MKTSLLLTILTSAGASLCCIVPILGIIGGSSSLLSSIAWLEPFRPFFIASTLGVLGFAWYGALKPKAKDDCGCEPKQKSLFESKKFLGFVTIFSLLLLSFPTYSKFILQNNTPTAVEADQTTNKKITIAVNGMTCPSCELHIEKEVVKLSGITSVKASYANNSATIEYNPEKVNVDKIIEAINKTGYKVEKSREVEK
jgi:mercuric ion transport protein